MDVKNKRILKPLLAVFLAASLVFGGVPVAYADDFEVDTEAELTTALTNAADGDTIRLGASVNYNSGIAITGKDITLDLQTFDLNVNAAAGIGLNLSGSGITLDGDGTLNIASTGGDGLYLVNSDVTVSYDGMLNITSNQNAIEANSNSLAIVTSAITTGNVYCINVSGGSYIEVNDDVAGYSAIYAGAGANYVYVYGDVSADGIGPGYGIHAGPDDNVIIEGSVESSAAEGAIVAAGAGSYVYAESVTSAGSAGVYADNDAAIKIDGNITASAIGAVGVIAEDGGNVIVNGEITAAGFAEVNGVARVIGVRTAPTTKLGYATYNETDSTVWVKAPNYSFTASPAAISSGGGICDITIEGVDMPGGNTIAAHKFGAPTTISGITAGSATEQTVTLTFPANTGHDTEYNVYARLDGGADWDYDSSADVTVAGDLGPVTPLGDPPTVTTDNVSDITSSGAALSGTVTYSGTAPVTERGFVYGTSTDPAINIDTKVTAAGIGTGTHSFTTTAGGLTAGTTYHVRAYATNSIGTGYGDDMTFTTLSAPPPPDPDDTGNGGGAGRSSLGQSYYAIVKENNIQVETLPVTVSSGTTTGAVMTGAVNLTGVKAAEFFAATGGAVIIMPSIPGVKSFNLEIPANSLLGTQAAKSMDFETPYGAIAIPNNMLSAPPEAGNKKAGIMIGQGDKTVLTDAEKAAVGSRPLIQLTLTLDGAPTAWTNPNAPVTVSIPYTPSVTELTDPESIIIWYIDGSGSLFPVPSGRYDPSAGTVTFTAAHFSLYAIGCNPISFHDVEASAWYSEAVGFIAAREITAGTGGGNFSPNAKLTRGEFIVMLMKAYGLAPDVIGSSDPMEGRENNTPETAINFADAGNTYYTGYLAAAKRLGISDGVGNNLFDPEKEITRQEMFTLLYNALKAIGQLPRTDNGESDAVNTGKALSDFSDAGDIASWAEEAMALFAETGTITGSNGKLSPADTSTRAEMAQVLYNLLSRQEVAL